MPRTARDVTRAELAVLQVLWQQGPRTIRQISGLLYPEGRASHYATVQKLLERLETKGHVGRDRTGSAHVFVARLERQELVARRLEAVAELCDGSLAPLLAHLLHSRKLSPQDRQALRQLLAGADS